MRRLIPLFVLQLVLAACGGGGGGGSAAADPFDVEGTWAVAQLSAQDGAYIGRFGTWTYGADQTATSSLLAFDTGMFDPVPKVSEGRVAIDEPGAYAIETLDAMRLFEGNLADNGAVGIGIGTLPSSMPTITVQSRRISGASAETMRGSYYSCTTGLLLFFTFSARVRATFDGAGRVSFSEDAAMNLGGGQALQGARPGETYSVGPTGELIISTPTRVGAVTADAEFAFAGGSAEDPEIDFPLMEVLIRTATSADPATFRGTYRFVRFTRGNINAVVVSGTISADGLGGMHEVLRWVNVDGLVTMTDGGGGVSRPYTVATDGSLEISDSLEPNTRAYHGAVSPSGRYAAFTTPGDAETAPSLTVLVRTSLEPL